MLHLVILLLVIALIAGVLGFTGLMLAAAGIAKIVFFIAIILFLISLITGFARGGFRRAPPLGSDDPAAGMTKFAYPCQPALRRPSSMCS